MGEEAVGEEHPTTAPAGGTPFTTPLKQGRRSLKEADGRREIERELNERIAVITAIGVET